MKKRTILITGASSGIGKETALTLAKEGHRLIIHGRDEVRTKQVYDEIVATGHTDVIMLTADFSLMSEVAKFAEQIKEKVDHIDVLYNNAGGQFGEKREVTDEGHEKTFAINMLAPFLLTKLLLPLLKKGNSSRVVTQSSECYRMSEPILDDIELENHYTFGKAYDLSKLYVWWIMREFHETAKREGIDNITFNTVEPGTALATDLGRVSKYIPEMQEMIKQYEAYSWSISEAAATGLYLITSVEVEGVSGKFYGNGQEKEIAEKWFSEEGQKIIWNYCTKACEKYLNIK